MSFKDVIKAEGKKTESVLGPYRDEFKESVTRTNAELETVTDSNVNKEFGAFLRKALGNVNGSVVAKPLPKKEGSGHSYGYGWGYSEKPITGVVTGRRFGFRLQGKANNYYIDDDMSLLAGLTGMHVDLIKRDSQRNCARDFYAFKCAYFKRYKSLFEDFNNKTYEVSIPVEVADLYKVSASGNDSVSVTVLNQVLKGEVTAVYFTLPDAKWIDDGNIDGCRVSAKSSLRSRYGLNTSHGISIGIKGKVDGKEVKFSDISLNLLAVDKDMNYIDKWFEPDYHGSFKIMNMAKVLECKPIQDLITEHMNYNKGVAKTFEYLRLKYAKKLILNGCF